MHPYAATSISSAQGTDCLTYDVAGNLTAKNARRHTWTSFDLPLAITQAAQSTQFAYTPTRAVYRRSSASGETFTQIGGLFEIVRRPAVAAEYRYWVPTPGNLKVSLAVADGDMQMSTVISDHLGLPAKVVNNRQGGVVASASFDLFGAQRDAQTWRGPAAAQDTAARRTVTDDGFGGNLQLDDVGVVHMNGRLYDPQLGAFLNVDPIADLSQPQTLHPYAWVANRGDSLADPSGLDDPPGWNPLGSYNDMDAYLPDATGPALEPVVITGARRPVNDGMALDVFLDDGLTCQRLNPQALCGPWLSESRPAQPSGMEKFLELFDTVEQMNALLPGAVKGKGGRPLGRVRSWRKADGAPRPLVLGRESERDTLGRKTRALGCFNYGTWHENGFVSAREAGMMFETLFRDIVLPRAMAEGVPIHFVLDGVDVQRAFAERNIISPHTNYKGFTAFELNAVAARLVQHSSEAGNVVFHLGQERMNWNAFVARYPFALW